jgi:putative tricarboxylic transport membrane protein
LLAGCAIIAFALLFGWQASLVPAGPAWATVGPATAPRIVTVLLGVLGLVLVAQAFLRDQTPEPRVPVNRIAFAWLFIGIALQIALIGSAGFVLASAVLFVCTARAFGSRRLLRDTASGLALAAIAHVVFARLLGYHIGGGLIGQFL